MFFLGLDVLVFYMLLFAGVALLIILGCAWDQWDRRRVVKIKPKRYVKARNKLLDKTKARVLR